MANPKIYALLVAIDDYPPPVSKLKGCKNDANAMKAYLEKRFPKEQLVLKTLYDKDATRLNILQTFEGHLGQAGKEDVALFYYAGHGSQEPANEAFWELEPDHKNETLVCYDSRIEDGMDLADKELASTIDCVAGLCNNVVLIIDACHSGGITRDVEEEGGSSERAVDEELRADPENYRPRPLDSYYLRNTSNSQARAVTSQDVKVLVPSPRHIVMTGALATQTSKETTFGSMRRGVFTFNLVKTLEEVAYPITYKDLIARVRAQVMNKANDQCPQIDLEVADDANRLFLGTVSGAKNLGYLMNYDSKNIGGWIINAGELLGIQAGAKVTVYNGDVQNLSDPKMKLGTATVLQITGTTSILQPNFNADTTKIYKAVLNSPAAKQVPFFIYTDNANVTAQFTQAFKNSGTAASYILLAAQAAQAEYIVYALQNQIVLGRKIDGMTTRGAAAPAVPLATQLVGITPENIAKAIENMEHIARWQNALDLGNPKSQIDASKIALTVYQVKDDGTEVPLSLQLIKDPKTGKNQLSPISVAYNNDKVLPRIRLKVKNNTTQRLYVAMLIVGSQFGIANIFKEQGYWLNPGEEAVSRSGRMIVPPEFRFFGRKDVTENYKLFVSTEQFYVQTLAQDDLGLPTMRDTTEKGEGIDVRGMMMDEEDGGASTGPAYDWTTITTQIKVKYTGV